MLQHRDFAHANRINRLIRRLVEGGFLQKWLRDNQVHSSLSDDATTFENQPLSIEHFGVPFVFLIATHICLVVTLRTEMFVYNYVRRTRHKGKQTLIRKLLVNVDGLVFEAGRKDFGLINT